MHYIAYYGQDHKARKLKKRRPNVRCYVLPSFAHLSPVLSGLNRV